MNMSAVNFSIENSLCANGNEVIMGVDIIVKYIKQKKLI
jgi:hypothetical protein